MANKGSTAEPDMRARLVGREVNKGGQNNDQFFASTPPLEAKKILFSQFSSDKNNGMGSRRDSLLSTSGRRTSTEYQSGISICNFLKTLDWRPTWLQNSFAVHMDADKRESQRLATPTFL